MDEIAFDLDSIVRQYCGIEIQNEVSIVYVDLSKQYLFSLSSSLM